MTPPVTRRAMSLTSGPKPRDQAMRLHILCPNCDQPAKASHKRQLSRIVTELVYNCSNPACGCSFVFVGEVHRLLRLPSQLDPGLGIALSPMVQRRELTDALRTLPTADVPTGEFVPPLRASEPVPSPHPTPQADRICTANAKTAPAVPNSNRCKSGPWSQLLD